MNILLVEDNPADVRLLKELLSEKQNAPAIHWASDGYEALDYVYQKGSEKDAPPPDVILLDLGLPRISGYDVLKEIKTNPLYSKIPIIILTTSRNPFDRSQCESLGADSFMSKPRSLKEFENLIQQLVTQDFPHFTKKAG